MTQRFVVVSLQTYALAGAFSARCSVGDLPEIRLVAHRETDPVVRDETMRHWSEVVVKDVAMPPDCVSCKLVTFDEEKRVVFLGVFRDDSGTLIILGLYGDQKYRAAFRSALPWSTRWLESLRRWTNGAEDHEHELQSTATFEAHVLEFCLHFDGFLRARCVLPKGLPETVLIECFNNPLQAAKFCDVLCLVLRHFRCAIVSTDEKTLSKWLKTLILFLPEHARQLSSTVVLNRSRMQTNCILPGLTLQGLCLDEHDERSQRNILEMEREALPLQFAEGNFCIIDIDRRECVASVMKRKEIRDADRSRRPNVVQLWDCLCRLQESKRTWFIINAMIDAWRRQLMYIARTYDPQEYRRDLNKEELAGQEVVASTMCDIEPLWLRQDENNLKWMDMEMKGF